MGMRWATSRLHLAALRLRVGFTWRSATRPAGSLRSPAGLPGGKAASRWSRLGLWLPQLICAISKAGQVEVQCATSRLRAAALRLEIHLGQGCVAAQWPEAPSWAAWRTGCFLLGQGWPLVCEDCREAVLQPERGTAAARRRGGVLEKDSLLAWALPAAETA